MEINQVKELVSTVDTKKFPFVADLIAANPAIAPESEDKTTTITIEEGQTEDEALTGAGYEKVDGKTDTVKDAEGKE